MYDQDVMINDCGAVARDGVFFYFCETICNFGIKFWL